MGIDNVALGQQYGRVTTNTEASSGGADAIAAPAAARKPPLVRHLALPIAAAALGAGMLLASRGRSGMTRSSLQVAGLAAALLGTVGAGLLAGPFRGGTPDRAPDDGGITDLGEAPTAGATPQTTSPPADARPAEESTDEDPSSLTGSETMPMTLASVSSTVPTLKVGSTGPAVAALQARLQELHYAVDTGGVFTSTTRDAVMAFQKINGLGRDGVAGPSTQAALDSPREPQIGAGKPNRVDVDLSSQTLVVVRGGKIEYIVNATSGNPNSRDGKGIATPSGTFSVERKVAGTRKAPLGNLYYPSYFSGGVAVHGSASVVAQRASHGCVRIPRWIEQRVFRDMPAGSQVVVHD